MRSSRNVKGVQEICAPATRPTKRSVPSKHLALACGRKVLAPGRSSYAPLFRPQMQRPSRAAAFLRARDVPRLRTKKSAPVCADGSSRRPVSLQKPGGRRTRYGSGAESPRRWWRKGAGGDGTLLT